MASKPGSRLLPIVDQLRSYDRRWLRGDLIAGVAVAALIVPKNLGYAGIAGVPLAERSVRRRGRRRSSTPSSAPAARSRWARARGSRRWPPARSWPPGSPAAPDVATFVAGITLASGLLFLLLAVLRMGWVARFLSRAVVTGFLFGAAIDVVIGELPKLTGTDTDGSNSFQELGPGCGTLGEADGHAVLVGVVALVVVFGLRSSRPRVPGALVLVVGGLLATVVLRPRGARGGAGRRHPAAGCPRSTVPDLGLLWDHAASSRPRPSRWC